MASAGQEPRLHGRRSPDPRARHRRHDRDLQRRLRRRPAAASAARAGAADGSLRNVPGAAVSRVRRQLHRCRVRSLRVRGDVGEAVLELQPVRRHDARAHHRRAGHRELLRRDGRAPAAGARLHRRGGSTRERTGRRPEPSAVDAPFRRQPLGRRQHGPDERRQLPGRGRHAAGVRSHDRQRRAVGPDRVYAGAESPARRALPQRLRAIEGGRDGAAGAAAARDRRGTAPSRLSEGCRRAALHDGAVQRRLRRRLRDAALRAARRGRGGVAHRVRQRREPAAGPRRLARARDRPALGARRRPGAHRAAVVDRKHRPGAGVGPRGSAARGLVHRGRRRLEPAGRAAPRAGAHRSGGARFRRRAGAREQHRVRPGPGAAAGAHRRPVRPARRRARLDRRRLPRSPARRADRRRSRALAAAALRRRPVDSQRHRARAGEPGVRSPRHLERPHCAAAGVLRRARAHRRHVSAHRERGRRSAASRTPR